jgi:polar amino acid transport system permease protein
MSDTDLELIEEQKRPGVMSQLLDLDDMPWWALILVVIGLVLIYLILANPNYADTFAFISEGVIVTLRMTLIAYLISIFIGLLTGLARTSKNKIVYTIATLYVESARGIPLIVLMLYVAFVVVPGVVSGLHSLGEWGIAQSLPIWINNFFLSLSEFSIRSIEVELRAIIALAIGYGAYEAEIFRAGIQSIGRGQMEAARSLGMTYFQAMRFIILPQAVRRVLPPLGNDFISMLKDSSLATVLAVREITQLGRLRRASTFRVFETFNVVTFLYLSMTLVLSAAVRVLERKLRFEE